ncbi:hypothetical protein PPERSA_05365 [Pseudocohnilembus persalinus]|uniref:Uncharacterized protein n=1 Tax=Pseudocohnilembus persalinus TaxID=266149 RepID=A0A0V0R7S5_PSEPJ|nr:hypothetical protein PPERSA_05365 [Pseudocohnilembus persalinus]|eukprot:KRX10545.1 hypothetical protein PPERSA_05365 [Pseudocohnilembus persalinus]
MLKKSPSFSKKSPRNQNQINKQQILLNYTEIQKQNPLTLKSPKNNPQINIINSANPEQKNSSIQNLNKNLDNQEQNLLNIEENNDFLKNNLNFISLATIADDLKENIKQLTKINNQFDPTLSSISSIGKLDGTQGTMRKWLLNQKQNLNDQEFLSNYKNLFNVKDILKSLKSNDIEDGLKKLFMIISFKSVIDLIEYNSQMQSNFSDYLANFQKQNPNKALPNLDKNYQIISENDKLSAKIKEQMEKIQQLKEENQQLKETFINKNYEKFSDQNQEVFQQLKFFYRGILNDTFKELALSRNDVVEKDMHLNNLIVQNIQLKTQIEFLEQIQNENPQANQKNKSNKNETESQFEWALKEECQRVKYAVMQQFNNYQKEVAEQKYQQNGEITQLKIQLQKTEQSRKYLLNRLQQYNNEQEEKDSLNEDE